MLKIQYNRVADKFESKYQQLRIMLGLDDTADTRQALSTFMGVVTCVAMYYALVVISKLLSVASQAADTVIAIIQ